MAWTERDSLILAIVIGLRKGLSLCRGMRRQLTEEEQRKVGQAIADQLVQSNYAIAERPPMPGHGQGWRFEPPDSAQP